MIPVQSPPRHYSTKTKCTNSLNRLRQSKEFEAMQHAQRHQWEQGRPVVWRWVPYITNQNHLNAAGVLRSSSLQQPQSQPPRVICATALETDISGPYTLPHLLSGGELRKARDSLLRKDASLSVPLTPILIPEVPTKIPPHVNVVDPITMNPIHSVSIPMAPASIKVANDSDVSPADSAGGGELEVATLLLNMGGGNRRSSVKESDGKKQQSNKNSDSKRHSVSSNTHSSSAPTIEDKYLDKWTAGSISLHTSEDDDVLSPLHCFMRRYCVEAFSATPEDVATPRYGKSHGFKVEVGQVGIRCLHCKEQPPSKRAERAVCYPSSLRNIYHSIETWQRRHSLVCKRITPWVKKSIVELMESSKTRAGGRRQYWEDSARRLGMVDTSQGVRFSRKPGHIGSTKSSDVNGDVTRDQTEEIDHEPQLVVRLEDKDLVTDYLFLLMYQMQTCSFTEEDRTGGRSKIKDNEVGFEGMECRHCQGRAGFGRYFPSSVSALSLANSDRNVYNHLQKCRKCPDPIKTELNRLQKDQTQSKNKRGLRKLFFNRIWGRMHGNNEDDKDKDKSKDKNYTSSSSLSSFPSLVKEPSSTSEMYSSTTRTESTSSLPPSMMSFSAKRTTYQYPVTVNNFR